MIIRYLILMLTAYLAGSIPTAYWFGKWFAKIDIREYGSGNSGATNALRVLGPKIAMAVLLIDALKGFGVTLLVCFLPEYHNPMHDKIIFGLLAVAGHIFPVWAGFRGGKGVAAMTGVIIGISPLTFLLCLSVFLVVVWITKFVSAGSLSSVLALPLAFYLNHGFDIYLSGFSVVLILIVLFTHRKNLVRLILGKENKLSFTKSKILENE